MRIRLTSAFIAVTCLAFWAPAAEAYPGANGRIVYSSPRTAPDPSKITLADYEIWTMNADGSDKRRLTNNRAGDLSPTWSSQDQIAFESLRDGNSELYVMEADGSNQRRLTNTAATESDSSWSPDGLSLVYQTTRYGMQTIEVLNLLDGSVRPITVPVVGDHDPAWASNGRILFVRVTSIYNDYYEIYTVDPDGKNLKRVTHNQQWDSVPAWSPNGAKIAFLRDAASVNDEIYTMDSDGSNRKRLTFNTVRDFEPAWSPDGKLISFHSGRYGPADSLGDDDIFVMNAADGSGRRQLTFDRGDDQASEWEPLPRPCVNVQPDRGGRKLLGTFFGDRISGRDRAERIVGKEGDDCLRGGAGDDVIGGGPGQDSLVGGPGADRIDCGPGVDRARADGEDRVRNCERVLRG